MDFKKKIKKAGFTLTELLIVIVIMGILTAVIIFNYGAFTSATLVTNMAYEIATEIRKSQTFGVAVRDAVGSGGAVQTDIAHGVFVELSGVENESENFILFSDTQTPVNNTCDNNAGSGNCDCSSGTQDECDNSFSLLQDIVISDLHGVTTVASSDTCVDIDDIHISFKRPNPEALIKSNDTINDLHTAQIEVSGGRAEDSSTRYIIVRSTGQISVENDPVCP
jgi:prepilin-type N-terminal cleavage/methylation domain-containing protein